MKLNANRVPLLVTHSAWDSVPSPRPLFVVNWDDIQVESDAWAYIILLALERYEICYYKDCGVCWLVLIAIKLWKEENDSLTSSSS